MLKQTIAQPYVLLATMHMAGVLAFCLHKIGHGRIEDKDGLAWNLLAVGSGPLIPLGSIGLMAGTLWALVALSFWKVALTLLVFHLVWGGVCWIVLGHARVHGYESTIYAVSIPLVITLRAVCAGAAVLLLVGLWQGYPNNG